MTDIKPSPIVSGIDLLNNLYEIFKMFHKTNSEKFENEWEKDLPKLTEAVDKGDIDAIARITAKYYNHIL